MRRAFEYQPVRAGAGGAGMWAGVVRAGAVLAGAGPAPPRTEFRKNGRISGGWGVDPAFCLNSVRVRWFRDAARYASSSSTSGRVAAD
jgi:hypothetical protein